MPVSKNQNQEPTQLSTSYSEADVKKLEGQIAKLQEQLTESDAKYAACESALKAKLGKNLNESITLPDVAWGLAWAEYFNRTKQFQFVGSYARSPKIDRHGNRWSLQSLPVIDGISGDTYDLLVQVAKDLGYDPHNPPKDECFMLHCFPQAGSYDTACVELEKAADAHIQAQRMLVRLERDVNDLNIRGALEAIPAAESRIRDCVADIESAKTKFAECKAVIEHAVQTFYLIRLDSFAMMDQYGIPINCAQATVVPQKKHQNLPDYVPTESHLISATGE